MTDTISSRTETRKRGKRTGRVGTVVSDKGDKTIKVKYEYTAKHPMYGKHMRRRTMLHVHDERNEAKTGDVVEVMACRRMSKTKCWRLVNIIRAD